MGPVENAHFSYLVLLHYPILDLLASYSYLVDLTVAGWLAAHTLLLLPLYTTTPIFPPNARIFRTLRIVIRFCFFVGLHLRNTEESRMPIEGPGSQTGLHRVQRNCYDPEYARMESWLDEHQDFVQDYFIRYYCGV